MWLKNKISDFFILNLISDFINKKKNLKEKLQMMENILRKWVLF